MLVIYINHYNIILLDVRYSPKFTPQSEMQMGTGSKPKIKSVYISKFMSDEQKRRIFKRVEELQDMTKTKIDVVIDDTSEWP